MALQILRIPWHRTLPGPGERKARKLDSMIYVGIVGHEAAKFTKETEEQAREIIRILLKDPTSIVVSGHCPLGGIDIWAEEEADKLGRQKVIYPPKVESWEGGYKPRNILIAKMSYVVHNIVVEKYPPDYKGKMRFKYCYHCNTDTHVKSGGCWTAKYAENKLRKPAVWHVIT